MTQTLLLMGRLAMARGPEKQSSLMMSTTIDC